MSSAFSTFLKIQHFSQFFKSFSVICNKGRCQYVLGFLLRFVLAIGKKPNAVCKELGFSTATATHWKNGTMPNGEALIKLSDYFGCSTDFLLGLADHPDRVEAELQKAQYIDLPPLQSKERTIFSEAEISVLWSKADQTIVQHILVMIYTGMRPAELLKLQLSNIHLSDHYMTGGVKSRKSKARKIIIPDRIAETVAQLVRAAQGERLSNYTKHNFYDEWNAFRASQGLRAELTPYCCRHTYITRLTALKVSPAMLQELAGHEDYETTLEYTHLSVADRLAEVNRLP